MDLILWRHAEAEVGEPDNLRVLTGKGKKQADRMARWLDRSLPETCRILSSPAVRAVQTVEALERKFKIHTALDTDASIEKILAAVNWPESRVPVLIVGHQPTLGRLASFLLTGTEQDWTIRKGAVWWIAQREQDDELANYLRAVIDPALLIK